MSLIAHYTFDNNNFKDSSGYNNHPEVVNNVSLTDMTAIGLYSGVFNGTNSYVRCPTSLKLPNLFSYNIWAYMEDWAMFATNNMRILSCTDSGGFNIETNNTTSTAVVVFAMYDSTVGYKNIYTTTTWASLGKSKWHMFSFTIDSNNKATAYIDGASVGTSQLGGVISYTDNYFFLGAEANGAGDPSQYFKGYLDDFRFYNHCLTESEVKDLYSTRAKIYKSNKWACSVFQEISNSNTAAQINKQGIYIANELVECWPQAVRYIKLTVNGSNKNTSNHITRLKYYTSDNQEVELINSENGTYDSRVKTHASLTSGSFPYYEYSTNKVVNIDLGTAQTLTHLNLRRYYADARTYYSQKIEGSLDNQTWFTIYDSGNTDTYNSETNTGIGLYVECASGKDFYLSSNVCMITKDNKLIAEQFVEE